MIVAGSIASLNLARTFVLIGTPVAAKGGNVNVTVGAAPGTVAGGACVSKTYPTPSATTKRMTTTIATSSFLPTMLLPSPISEGD